MLRIRMPSQIRVLARTAQIRGRGACTSSEAWSNFSTSSYLNLYAYMSVFARHIFAYVNVCVRSGARLCSRDALSYRY